MKFTFQQKALIFIATSTLIRLFFASQLEFGNDEVYYWLYAKYPDISHFDHPSMVGFFIQLFTFNLSFSSELFIRLAAIFPASISMWIVFLIGKKLHNEKTGFISVILYNLSFYGLIISGTFILPDAPMVLCWLLSFFFFLKTIPYNPRKVNNKELILAFLFAGFAIYSKYQAIYLLFGVVLYVIFFNRKWLKIPFFYLLFLVPLLFIGIIFYWNFQNDFISYQFHQDRVSIFEISFNKDSFFREILGQIFYNNPYVFIVTLLAIIAYFKNRLQIEKKQVQFFLTTTLPLLGTTIYLALSRSTLPHWSGISYITLLPIAAIFITNRKKIITKLSIGFGMISFLLVLAVFTINKGWFLTAQKSKSSITVGKNDVLMDLYGWKQAGKKINQTLKKRDLEHLQIVSNKWHPAAHIDYYIARPLGMQVYGLGSLKNIHKYYWINLEFKPLANEVLYITDSRNFEHPTIFKEWYPIIEPIDTIAITRATQIVKNVFIFKLKNSN